MASKPTKAILLLAFGGADSIENLEPFIKNVLKGRPVTAEMVEKAKERYNLIGGGSPLLKITEAQAKGIEDILNKDPEGQFNYKAYVGMRYWHPYIKDTLKNIKDEGIEEAIGVIMAPILSMASTGGYSKEVNAALEELGGGPNVVYTTAWHINPSYVSIMADKVNEQLAAFPDRKDVLVIFSNHSLPKTVLEGDPYEMMIHQSIEQIISKIGKVDYKAGYQSAGSGPREWLGPKTEDLIIEAKKKGKKGIILVPHGFAADHVETLYDIDILFRKTAESLGLVFKRSASLNTTPKFLEFLAGLVKKQAERRQ